MDGWMGSMWIWWFVGAVPVAIVVWAVLSSARRAMRPGKASAEQLLIRRYAKGELDRVTYERMRRELPR